MFTHGLKSLNSIPWTQNALFQHAKWALHTAGFIWKQSFSRILEYQIQVTGAGNGMPEPTIYWADLSDVSKA